MGTPANDFVAWHSPQHLDLSRNKSLRMLQVPLFPVNRPSRDISPDATSRFLNYVLSTITSPAFFKITVLYGNYNFSFIDCWCRLPLTCELSQTRRAKEVSRHRGIFEVFRRAHQARGFQLELCASTCGSAGEEPVRILEEAIAEEKAKNGFNGFLSDPYVEYNPQRCRLYNDR
jgi:hypothetical protein